jgi:hypothetical protein
MPTFDYFLTQLRAAIGTLAAKDLGSLELAALKDGTAFIQSARADLETWTAQLTKKEISPDEFADLVEGEKDLAKMEALKEAGLAMVKIQQFQADLIQTVINTARRVFP